MDRVPVTLWTPRKDHVTWSCELHVRGEWGVEATILRDDEFVVSRRFYLKWQAEQWAENERRAIEKGDV